MPRATKEWRGRTPDTDPPPSVKLRILRDQHERCVDCGREFGPKNPPEFDHERPLWAGGENRESNIKARCDVPCHERKTGEEATARAKADRGAKNYFNLKPPSKTKRERYRRPLPGTKRSGWKHKLDGTWERR